MLKEARIMENQKAISQAQKRAHKKYMERFVEIKVRMTPNQREKVKDHAKQQRESTTAFINRAILEAMERDKAKENQG